MNSHHDPQDDRNRRGSEAEARRGLPAGADDDPSTATGSNDSPGRTDLGAPAETPPGQQPPEAHRFFVWLRGLNVRRGEDRWIGGVASGIAARIGIDPVIVRGLFILFVIFGGVGVLLYGIAWALLPEPDGRIHLEGATRGYWSDGMTGAMIVTIFGLIRPFGSWWDGGWDFGDALWTLIWVGGLVALCVWLVNSVRDRKQKRRTAGSGPGAGPPTAAYTPGTGPQEGYEPPGPTEEHAWPKAPAGTDTSTPGTSESRNAGPAPSRASRLLSDVHHDTLGLAEAGHYPGDIPGYGPASGYVPDPVPGAQYAVRTKSRRRTPSAAMVAISTGLALLVGGGLLALHYTGTIDLGLHANSAAAAAAAVVLGLSVVVSGLRGRTSGTMGFFAVVALIAAAVFGLVPTSSNYVIASSTSWQPDTVEAAETGYTTTMARATLDLGNLSEQAPLDEETVIPVNVAMGNTTVILPDDVPVEVHSDVVAGAVDFVVEGTGSAGAWNPANRTFNVSAPGEKVIIDVDGFFSSVTIAGSRNGFSQ